MAVCGWVDGWLELDGYMYEISPPKLAMSSTLVPRGIDSIEARANHKPSGSRMTARPPGRGSFRQEKALMLPYSDFRCPVMSCAILSCPVLSCPWRPARIKAGTASPTPVRCRRCVR